MEPVLNKTLLKLSERAKELECLYKVEEALNSSNMSEVELFGKLLKIVPSGMQYSTVCEIQIKYGNQLYQSEEYHETDWLISSDLVVDKDVIGRINVVYTQLIDTESNQFLPDEQRMLDNIASRISCWLFMLIIKASAGTGK